MEQIWDIIPKITSPLAALCFGFYIFYLYKQSNSKQKEESLKVSSSKAQVQAVDLILKDYPDIKIDPIKDPAAALELAKQIIHDKLEKYQKTLNSLLIFTGIFVCAYVITAFMADISKSPSNEPIKSSISWAESQAISMDKPYLLLSIICHISIEDEKVNNKISKRKALFRYHYTLKALKDIDEGESVFEEQYITNKGEIQPWPGSNTQDIESIVDGRYWVRFSAKKDEILTLTTGANYSYSLPFSLQNSTGCFSNMTLLDNEWFTCYPNANDYIDNLTIIIEGKNVDISLPRSNSAYRKKNGGSLNAGDGSCKVYSSNNFCTLVAKWGNISPGECVGFKINW